MFCVTTAKAQNSPLFSHLPTKYKALSKETVYTYNTLNQLIDVNFNTDSDVNTHYVYNNYTIGTDKFYTNQLNCETTNGTSYHYSYDNVGNITAIKKGTGYGTTTSAYRTYTYDELDRLKTETNGISNFTSTYTYDHLGNILQKDNTLAGANHSKVTYTYSKDSSTGWNYLLTKVTFTDYTNNTTKEENIYYDAIGNPYSYRGAIMGWYGRQMITHSKNGVESSFTYDADGLRSSKTVAGVKTEYQYVGDKLFYEKRGDGNSFYYFYDSYGKLSAIYHHVNGTKTAYHVVTNAQGDVIALYSWAGALVASYEYDAWGNIISVKDANGNAITSQTHIAHLNPFRYRSYYYDRDLGLYYLQSRYYDSEIGRFINADGTLNGNGDIMGYNMYVYCSNNPVMFSDPSGHGLVDTIKSFLSMFSNEDDEENDTMALYSEHHKKGTTNPSNKNKHQKGQSRKKRDRHGGEKGDIRRNKNRSNKRHNINNYEVNDNIDVIEIEEYNSNASELITISALCVLAVYVVANDMSGVGVVDDALLVPVGIIIWDIATV